MHPEISLLPSRMFYKGLLENGVSATDRAASFHRPSLAASSSSVAGFRGSATAALPSSSSAPVSSLWGPFVVVDCSQGREQRGGGGGGGGGSVQNYEEAKVAASMYRGRYHLPVDQGTGAW